MNWVQALRLKILREDRPAARRVRLESVRDLESVKAQRAEVERTSAEIEQRVLANGFSAAITRTMRRRHA